MGSTGKMAGKSNKGRGKRASHNAVNSSNPTETAVVHDVPVENNIENASESANLEVTDVSAAVESTNADSVAKEQESVQKQGKTG